MITIAVTRYYVSREGHESAITGTFSGPESKLAHMVQLGVEQAASTLAEMPKVFGPWKEMTDEEARDYQARLQRDKKDADNE